MGDAKLRILVVGAHPDDCEYKAGGMAALYRDRGDDVCFVSVTNGEAGHHRFRGEELVAIRRAEAAAAGRVLGLRYEILDFPDGQLEPTLAARNEIIALIRRYRPDLMLTHRPNDYHPDHRYTSQLVQDCSQYEHGHATHAPVLPVGIASVRRLSHGAETHGAMLRMQRMPYCGSPILEKPIIARAGPPIARPTRARRPNTQSHWRNQL